jgi:hypothetical protein
MKEILQKEESSGRAAIESGRLDRKHCESEKYNNRTRFDMPAKTVYRTKKRYGACAAVCDNISFNYFWRANKI